MSVHIMYAYENMEYESISPEIVGRCLIARKGKRDV